MPFIEDVSGKPEYEIQAIILMLRSFGYHAEHVVTKRNVRIKKYWVQEELIIF